MLLLLLLPLLLSLSNVVVFTVVVALLVRVLVTLVLAEAHERRVPPAGLRITYAMQEEPHHSLEVPQAGLRITPTNRIVMAALAGQQKNGIRNLQRILHHYCRPESMQSSAGRA